MADNTAIMLQAIIDGQTAIKEELKKEIRRVEDNLSGKIQENNEAIETNGARLDKLGTDLAQLADDAPTNEEFDKHEERITALENQLAKS